MTFATINNILPRQGGAFLFLAAAEGVDQSLCISTCGIGGGIPSAPLVPVSPVPRNEVQEPRSPSVPAKHSGLLNYGSHYHLSFSAMHIDHEECRRLAASCRRLANTAPSSFLAAKL